MADRGPHFSAQKLDVGGESHDGLPTFPAVASLYEQLPRVVELLPLNTAQRGRRDSRTATNFRPHGGDDRRRRRHPPTG